MRNNNKKLNIFIYFILVLILYLLFELFTTIFMEPFAFVIKNGKYSVHLLSEVCWLFIIICTIFLFKKEKILSNKEEGFFKTLFICFPLTLIALVYFSISSKQLLDAKAVHVISLMLYSFSIGLAEELLVRGWILNLFLDKYNKNRKEVILSIIFSALVFGGMHITNLWYGGQTLSETIAQIVFATGAGFFFGAAYFRTKNIIALAFLHGFYDFSILLEDINKIRECTSLPVSVNVSMYSLTLTTILSLILVISGFVIIRKSKTNKFFKIETTELIESKDSNFKVKSIFACIVLYFIMISLPTSLFNVNKEESIKKEICYNYPKIIMNNIETTYNNYKSYTINNNDINYIIQNKNKKLILKVNNKSYEIDKDIVALNVVNNNDNYIVYYLTSEENSSNTIIHYSKYIVKDQISLEENYIKEFIQSFTTYGMSIASTLGTIKESNYDYIFPMVKDYNNNFFLIDEENVVRLVTIDTKKKSDLVTKQNKANLLELTNKYQSIIPFINFNNDEYIDAYQEKILTTNSILSYTYSQAVAKRQDTNKYTNISNEELRSSLKNDYNIEIGDITSFNINNGLVNLIDNNWVYTQTENLPIKEKVSKITNSYFSSEDFIIEEKAGFIYGDTINKYSDLNSAIYQNEDIESLKNYFTKNIDSFVTFKHTFKYNKETDNYYYFSTTIE